MEVNQRVRVSVRNLVEFILRFGDIDSRRGGLGEKEAMQEGSRIHRKLQARMGAGYQAEVSVAWESQAETFTLAIEGRADGVFREKTEDVPEQKAEEILWIDEIKGVYRDLGLMEEPNPIHLAQAKCYAFILGEQQGERQAGVQMTYCNLETEEIRRFRQIFSLEELREWFFVVVEEYKKWVSAQSRWRGIRQDSIRQLTFPYPWRPGQKQAAALVYRNIAQGKRLFVQAATGTGKTLSTVFPAVKAVGEGLGEQIFYMTAKTITRTVAEETFGLLKRQGLKMKVLTVTAKEKICPLEETECNPDACPYAKGHYDRVNQAVFELLHEADTLDRNRILRQAEKWQVCPFEMSLDAAVWSDAVICDYNYVFDPRARLKRFFGEGVKGNYLFLIDEAHNLAERGREMFSAALYKEDFLELKREMKLHSRKVTRSLERCNSYLLGLKRECQGSFQLQKDTGLFPVYLLNLSGAIEEFLENSRNSELNQKTLDFYFQVRSFLEVCDRLDENYVIYTEHTPEGKFMIKLFCVDVSENLRECLDKGKSAVFFSATLLPIRYYKSLLTGDQEDDAVYVRSAFDPERKLVMIGTDTSSRYTRRGEEEYRKMASYVCRTVQTRKGNYMVFFSSYKMLEEVAGRYEEICREEGIHTEVVCQTPGMGESQREEFLKKFQEPGEKSLVGFCVMGGIFGEGIDLKKDSLIGAVIVGTGIPQVCNEREILKQFYDRRQEDGFFYAYLCPGMNKVLQSAGRVIRTDEDEGVILLLDERFSSLRYRQMFPAEWETPELCTLETVEEKTRQFWKNRDKGCGAALTRGEI